MITIHDVEQNTEQWLKLREPYITASDAFRLLSKGNRFQKTKFNGNFFTKRGHLLEPEALGMYHIIKDSISIPHGFVTNDKYPNGGASPDDLTETIYIEVKCFNKKRHKEMMQRIYPEVMAQVQFGLMITEYKLAHIVLYNPDLPAHEALVIIEVKPNKYIQSNIKRALNAV